MPQFSEYSSGLTLSWLLEYGTLREPRDYLLKVTHSPFFLQEGKLWMAEPSQKQTDLHLPRIKTIKFNSWDSIFIKNKWEIIHNILVKLMKETILREILNSLAWVLCMWFNHSVYSIRKTPPAFRATTLGKVWVVPITDIRSVKHTFKNTFYNLKNRNTNVCTYAAKVLHRSLFSYLKSKYL